MTSGNRADKRRPVLQFCVFCDGVADGPGTKKSYIGVFDFVVRPSVVPQFVIPVRWVSGMGTFVQQLRILKPNLEPLMPPQELQFTLPNRVSPVTVHCGIGNVRFEEPGVYWVEVWLDGEREAAFPLPVYRGSEAMPAAEVSAHARVGRSERRRSPKRH